jgi:hypothetical protein
MELGYFTMPSHPPERPLTDGHERDLVLPKVRHLSPLH